MKAGTVASGRTALTSAARRWVWALPAWGVLLGLSTLSQQPSYDTDFAGYAEYVTTGRFLASHLVASILGAALGVVGAVALLVLLAETPGVRLAFGGVVAFAMGQVVLTSVFGVAAFFQPAIGHAFLAGQEAVAVRSTRTCTARRCLRPRAPVCCCGSSASCSWAAPSAAQA